MRILYVADGRSPIALSWIEYFIQQGHEVHLASSFACRPDLAIASQQVVPVAFSVFKSDRSSALHPDSKRAPIRQGFWSAPMVSVRTRIRQWLGPLTLPKAARQLASYIHSVQPDLIHAMRIPYEGMTAALAQSRIPERPPPLLVSVWGNDFTLHAPSNPWMSALTRRTLSAAIALHTDCRRDLILAGDWGFDPAKAAVVLPSAGGVRTGIFNPPGEGEAARSAPVVVNPRGFRAYVRNDTFFKAIPLVLENNPHARFLCPAMAGDIQAGRWLDRLDIAFAVKLLPVLSRREMADCFRRAPVAVSPATHDGTPNTLLEAMACGCFPIAGDLDSLREWINPGENGLLIDPGNPSELAQAILLALSDANLRKQAQLRNSQIISERAAYDSVMPQAESFYLGLTQPAPSR
jgi:glycosyltransferase involved in cell wall biosynthesis